MSRFHLLASMAGLLAGVATATPSVIHGDVIGGPAAFDDTVRRAGGQVWLQPMRDLAEGRSSWSFADFTIRSNNGMARLIEPDYARLRQQGLEGALSGAAIGLSVNEPAELWGLTFEFTVPVNAFGLEVGDWATCCWPSALYIAFDGGAVREVATANRPGDNPGLSRYGQFTNFVGAFDTAGRFTRVTFYGAGVGEYMVGGGTVRYGWLDETPDERTGGDTTGGPAGVPEPPAWVLVLGALAAMGATDHALRRGRHGLLAWQRRQRGRRLARGAPSASAEVQP